MVCTSIVSVSLDAILVEAVANIRVGQDLASLSLRPRSNDSPEAGSVIAELLRVIYLYPCDRHLLQVSHP